MSFYDHAITINDIFMDEGKWYIKTADKLDTFVNFYNSLPVNVRSTLTKEEVLSEMLKYVKGKCDYLP